MDRTVALGDGFETRLESWGSAGPIVLCVHGMSGAATNWTDLIAELAPDFDCAAVDLPGSGFSAPPSWQRFA